MRKQKIELFINSLDLSDVVASIIPEGEENFTVKLRRIGKAGRLAKQAELYAEDNPYLGLVSLSPRKGRIPIVVYCHLANPGLGYSFSDAYLSFGNGKISIRKRHKPISFSVNVDGGFVVPEEFREQMLMNLAQFGGVPARLIRGERLNLPVPRPVTPEWTFVRRDDEAARIAWDGVAPYSVGIDAARTGQDITVFARRFADATGRSAADVEDDIQNVINLEVGRRIDQTLLEGDEGETDGE